MVDLSEALEQIKSARKTIREALVGKTAVVVSDFNGQPHGSSRPSMKGKAFEIVDAYEDCGRIYVAMHGERVYLALDEVRVDS